MNPSLEDLLSPELLAFVRDSPENVPRPTTECATSVGVGVRAPPKAVDVQVATPPAIATSTLDDLEMQKFVEDQRNQYMKRRQKAALVSGTGGARQ